MTLTPVPVGFADIGHRVRELVCTYRPARDHFGLLIQVPTRILNEPRTAAIVLGPLVANHPIELFGVACLSARHELLAWHLLARGTRTSAQVSVPDVFVPAIVTPGTAALVLVHNHPSGNPTPSVDDARLTVRLGAAADLLDLGLLDHLIVGDDNRYFSFREAGQLLREERGRTTEPQPASGHHVP
jgi:DNA repair protein RadC